MSKQSLIVYNSISLYQILKEIDLDFNFDIFFANNVHSLNKKLENLKNYLIISNKDISHNTNLLILENMPINIKNLVEKINISFLKLQFNNQSKEKIKNYILDFNSREIQKNKIKMKLTEREMNTILYLSKSIKAVSINELQSNVWEYQKDIETHTVETHIYRLRKKFLMNFNDENFIVSNKDGYQIG